jgi:hypothetical protein
MIKNILFILYFLSKLFSLLLSALCSLCLCGEYSSVCFYSKVTVPSSSSHFFARSAGSGA